MTNDKYFGIYAITLLAAVASVLTASVMAGVTTVPSPLLFLEHLALGLGFRAAYKGIPGFANVDWPWQVDAPQAGVVETLQPAQASDYADAA